MSPATILALIEIVNGLLTIAKTVPTVMEEVHSLLVKVSPHVDAAGADVQKAFADIEAKVAAP